MGPTQRYGESYDNWLKRAAQEKKLGKEIDAALEADELYTPGNMKTALKREGTGNKPQLSYILEFERALDLIAGVMERGAEKYARTNWKGFGPNSGLPILLDSVMRHLKARMNHEVYDKDMGTDHLANAACGLLFALYHHGEEPANVEPTITVPPLVFSKGDHK